MAQVQKCESFEPIECKDTKKLPHPQNQSGSQTPSIGHFGEEEINYQMKMFFPILKEIAMKSCEE